MRSIAPKVLAALLLVTAARPASAQPAAAASLDPADVEFKRGNELYTAKRYADAEQAYLRAWATKKTFDIATNLGHAQVKQEKYRDAAEHFEFALRNYPATSAVQDQRELLRRAFEDAKKQIGTLRIRASVDGATVLVDGKPAGTSPMAAPIFVEAGPHVVVAKLQGYADATQNVDAQRGSEQDVALTLAADPNAPPAGPTEVQHLGAGWYIGGAVLAAGGVVLGVVGVTSANGKASDAERLQGVIGSNTGACVNNGSANCAQLLSDAKGRKTWSGVAAAGFVAGGAFALGTVGLLVWDRSRGGSSASPSGRVDLSPVASPEHLGLRLHGRF